MSENKAKATRKSIRNLTPNSERTPKERREIAKKGGIASGKVRAERKTLSEELKALLSVKNDDGLKTAQKITLALIEQAVNGNVKAFEVIRDTIGEKPKDNLNLSAGDGVVSGVQVTFVDKSRATSGQEKDPKIVGEYSVPIDIGG